MLEVLDFYADWCGTCQMMEQVLPEVEKELAGRATFRKVDVETAREEAERYQVMNLPTFVILKDGQEVDRLSEFMPKEKMVGWIQGFL